VRAARRAHARSLCRQGDRTSSGFNSTRSLVGIRFHSLKLWRQGFATRPDIASNPRSSTLAPAVTRGRLFTVPTSVACPSPLVGELSLAERYIKESCIILPARGGDLEPRGSMFPGGCSEARRDWEPIGASAQRTPPASPKACLPSFHSFSPHGRRPRSRR